MVKTKSTRRSGKVLACTLEVAAARISLRVWFSRRSAQRTKEQRKPCTSMVPYRIDVINTLMFTKSYCMPILQNNVASLSRVEVRRSSRALSWNRVTFLALAKLRKARLNAPAPITSTRMDRGREEEAERAPDQNIIVPTSRSQT